MDLTLLADFNLVAAREGFAAASRASGRSKATLSRNVRRLEHDLGTRLIERTSRAFQLTQDGRMLSDRSESLLAELHEIAREITGRGPEPRGRLRISAPLVFSHVFLGRLAAGFMAAYPLVELEATVEDRRVDLVEDGYDAVVRVNPDRGSPLVGRCFFHDSFVLVAPPSLGRPSPDDRRPVPALVLTDRPDPTAWRVTVDGETREIGAHPQLRLPSLLMLRDAVVAGAGAAALPRSIVGQDIASGRLVAWGDLADSAVELWVLHTSRRAANNKVTAFVDFICEWFSPAHAGQGPAQMPVFRS